MREILVRTSRDTIEEQSSDLIKKSLIKEADLPRNLADKISKEVTKDLQKLKLKFVSGPLIREMVCVKLLGYGLEEARAKYTRLGLSVSDTKEIIFSMNKENANINYNPEFVHKELGDAVAKQYALLSVIPLEASDAHMGGEIHVHQLEYFIRPFCFEHCIPFFLKRGITTDGLGVFTGVAGPAKHFDSAMMQLSKVLQVSEMFFNGGQGYDSFNVYLAPYARGLNYREIKQVVQRFIYDLDTTPLARGGQTAFTNVSLEFDIPSYMEDMKVILPGGKKGKETYSNYLKESRLILRAFVDNYLKGDYTGKQFHFPKPEFKLRKGIWNDGDKEEIMLLISELTAKFGTPYFLNMVPDYMPNCIQSQCCRYFLTPTANQLQELKKGRLRFGSLQVVTLNLPRYAYEARDEEEFFEAIDKRIELCKLVFKAKRDCLRKYILNGGSPFLMMDFDGEPYFVLDKSTDTVGFVGLNEALKILTNNELHESKDSWRLGLKIIKYLRKKCDELSKRTGNRCGLVQTPAESTAHRFALSDLKRFGNKAVVKGDKKEKAVYYTNSSHVYVGANIPLWERIKIESSFHPLVQGGAMTHVFLGEKESNPESLLSMTKKISKNSLCSYFAFTKDISQCRKCSKVSFGLVEKCPHCGATGDDVEWYSRITGYYTPIKHGWNKGKRAELNDRRRYSVGG